MQQQLNTPEELRAIREAMDEGKNPLVATDVPRWEDQVGISRIVNRRVLEFEVLPTPAQVLGDLPLSDQAQEIVAYSRDEIRACLYGQDDRLLVIVGPCSVHDPAAALDYARRLAALKDELGGELLIVMRVYFEKPRTTVGWKGLINDPDIDGSCNIKKRPAFGPSYAAWRIGRRFGHRHGIPGTNQPAIHFRRGQLGCDRRSQYGKPGAPPARFGHVDADRLQKRYRRFHQSADRLVFCVGTAAYVLRHRSYGSCGRSQNARQSRLPCGIAWFEQRPEL